MVSECDRAFAARVSASRSSSMIDRSRISTSRCCHLDLRGHDLLLDLLKERACLFDGHCPGSPVPHALSSFRSIWREVGPEKPSFKTEQPPSGTCQRNRCSTCFVDWALPRRGS